MIVRNLGLRHGRRVAAVQPSSPTCLVQGQVQQVQSRSLTIPPAPPISRTNIPEPPKHGFRNKQELAIVKEELAKIPGTYEKFTHIQKQTLKLGSDVKIRYLPDEVLKNPPHDATLEDLMAAQAHMGHNTSVWNPANARYIYGVRAGIHIISLEVTASHLRRAARVVEEVAYHGGLILFVGNRPGHMPIVVRAAELAQSCHLFQKWTPGTITNREVLLDKAPIQIVDERDRPLPDFEEHLMDRMPLVPDLVVCLNPVENYTMLYECGLTNIPTIGIIDTDADPTWVTYQIPANDDSLRATALIAGVLGRAGQRGQARRLADAEKGHVAWHNPREIQSYMRQREMAKQGARWTKGDKEDESTEEELRAMLAGTA